MEIRREGAQQTLSQENAVAGEIPFFAIELVMSRDWQGTCNYRDGKTYSVPWRGFKLFQDGSPYAINNK
jgi:hypothetical protein